METLRRRSDDRWFGEWRLAEHAARVSRD